MADQETNAGGNGADNSAQPQVSILAQYVKDLSVENPSAPQVYSWQVQPQLDVQFNINIDAAGEHHEVTLKFDISARSDHGVHFVVDLSYGGLFSIRNVPQEAMAPFLLIEAPRLLFPFARAIVADLTRDGGFTPLLLQPIDFVDLYRRKLAERQGESLTTPPAAPAN